MSERPALSSAEGQTPTLDPILGAIRSLAEYQEVLDSLLQGQRLPPLSLPRAARLPIVCALQEDTDHTVVLVTDRADHALAGYEELAIWGRPRRYLLPEPSPLFYERASWGASARRERIQSLAALVSDRMSASDSRGQPCIVVASARALMTRTMPCAEFLRNSLNLSTGMAIQPDALWHRLVKIGYQRTNTVLEPGQFSSRGGLLDLWPPAHHLPLRLDFFGAEIETIRRFDPASQRTVETTVSALVTPAREYLAPSGGNESARQPQSHGDRDGFPETSEFDIPIIHPDAVSLLDYVPANALVVLDDLGAIQGMVDEIEEQAMRFRQTSVADGVLPAEFPLPYSSWTDIQEGLESLRTIDLGRSSGNPRDDGAGASSLASHFGHDERFAGRIRPFTEYLHTLAQRGQTSIVVSRQSARIRELWAEGGTGEHDAAGSSGALPGGPLFIEGALSEGFMLGSVHLITDSEIFGWGRPVSRARQRQTSETPEAFYADLRPGDFVVHIDHGVGRFVGLVQRNLEGREREFLTVEYEAGGQLFVPVHQADRLTRYVGAEGAIPALDRLGGQEWHEKKGRAKEAVLEVAQDMLDLHARRQIVRGHAFKPDTIWQTELEDSFPYVETEDQARAMREIKQDMESQRPMDRLLCGDVGYGKTELALRAAFKAVMDGRQVALLVPTTVLAQQHYETFAQRLAAFPVQVEMLSRFRTPREQSEILSRLARGDVDIVIGTHRLLSADVQFRDLGLVVIDEEQRFGVTHKEQLKKLRAEVDVLTLTATPIPRTLYMALTGVRDISTLNTPPEERLPIVTHVGPYTPKLARQAIVRELERGGQIFFVHNRVNTIDAMRVHLSQLVPEARLDVGHGQMPEHELAEVMHRFNRGETDILLSTTIIESGLDIPNANTLIVDRADTFGLAQLYQLRGRVGRGAARAYAYFFRHRKLSPTIEGQQRLEVIAENTELGAGYSIAMRDLEIRGAGELLGTRQHGHIQAVGFHLYTRLLADAVRQLRRDQAPQGVVTGDAGSADTAPAPLQALKWQVSLPVTVELPLAAGIPSAYIPDADLRLRLYRRMADIRDEAEVDALESEFGDRFGPPPEMVRNLFYQLRVKLRAERAGLAAISSEGGQFVLRLPPPPSGTEQPRLRDLGPGIRGGKAAYWCNFGANGDWMPRLLEVLDRLAT